ncbi:hypothetical protein HRR83_003293 [Exophiala dermatitidis]|uniref:Uncharacterized protein n=1 Tax=Exophiala dermatitidis TaxID=5970 RepID=A0AAN6EV68_EXODE|nr:hypothetical protein HRR74_004549 [Exophiala dermatitidis]KAJ4521152.1 hypothetical protein HRR73_003493 [Exophiala dermatitidis]KAJ4547741.1 hypothetical protein HRR76_000367 [Exophiala dermatitidis]KAJ4553678.1 hypothetical protein HRR77_002055 [Exophiala dermatitidis]KAJ4578005.1 hypothetical protein HRR79_001325 [Exophiala dermatitidis]
MRGCVPYVTGTVRCWACFLAPYVVYLNLNQPIPVTAGMAFLITPSLSSHAGSPLPGTLNKNIFSLKGLAALLPAPMDGGLSAWFLIWVPIISIATGLSDT